MDAFIFWLSAKKDFKGEDNRPLFFKTICYWFYCSFACFFLNFFFLGGGDKFLNYVTGKFSKDKD